jgi:GT2 family glycosyltransferase/tetratricopeptide (TPR) repeat protein/2-polyprenyl-3-methyl-5-hydroxy-6-metoxy-1,4-benzoquinol methylase
MTTLVPASRDSVLPALLECVPQSARRVLDIGCGAGTLGKEIKARQPAEIIGMEFDEKAASTAREKLDQVIVGEIEAMDSWAPDRPYECIVCEDQLSCMSEPDRWLGLARQWLADNGTFIASIPNIRHHSVVSALLAGKWPYQAIGSRRPQIRFFTRREIEKLFYRAGLGIQELKAVPGAGHDEWERRGRPAEVEVGSLRLAGLTPDQAEEFYVAHYVISARPMPPCDLGLTSIVILTHNQLACTRLCVDSIRQFTDEPYELIFVDNASSDGTPDYLASQTNVKVIRNKVNCGFPAAANQGMRAATGKQVLLLNNDTVVTTGWLRRLLRTLHSDTRIGLVGPCSNCVSGEQQVAVAYEDLRGLDGFAWDWGKAHNRTVVDTDRIVGFCLLIRREVMDKVGLLDERFGLGCFDDDDYCRRTLAAGYRAVIARDAFVHHFGGRTFVGTGVDFAALMRHNEQLYQAKWKENGATRAPQLPEAKAIQRSRPAYKVRVGSRGGLLLAREKIQLSLCMIVRDNARTIRPCLESIRPWVDEMVVVDTGSKDETPLIAEQLGAKVFHFPWCDSFSAARNESLRHARGKWVFWMDSDDTIDADNGRRLRQLADTSTDQTILGYVVQVHCPGPEEDGHADITAVDHVKLFRNLPELRFDGRIHEQIIPAIRRLGGEIAWTDLFVVHSGYDHSPEGQRTKLERDLRLLHLELRERPEHPFTLFNLGMTCTDAHSYQEALDYLRRCIKQSGEGESHVRKAYAYLVCCHEGLGQSEFAWEACQEGLHQFPLDAELRFRKATLLHKRGRLEEAVRAYLDLFQTSDERHFSSVVAGITSFLARHNLALVYRDLGDLAREEQQWRLVVQEKPKYRSGWHGLGEVLLHARKYDEAQSIAEQLIQDRVLRSEGLTLKAQVGACRGDWDGAKRQLEAAVKECPEDLEPLQALCRLLFEHGEPAAAERALQELIRRAPTDAAAYHNLGTVYRRMGRNGEAVHSYRQSLKHRPDAPATYLELGQALNDSGRSEEAVASWQEVLRLSPGNRAAKEALAQARRCA